jgi:D-lactate dehydrogenase
MNKKLNPQEVLGKSKVFSSLDEEALTLLEQRMKLIHFSQGDLICREGETGDRMFIIARGEVEVLKSGDEDTEVKIATLKPGEVAGIMSLFEEDVRSASLRAKGPVDIWTLDMDTFKLVLSRKPEIAWKLLAYMSRRLRLETGMVAQFLSEDMDRRLKVAFFDSKPYTEACFRNRNKDNYTLHFFEPRLNIETVSLAAGFQVICAFVNDHLNSDVVKNLAELGVEMIALRCAGYNNVDLETAYKRGISVARVPAYSPYAVAEHAAALIMALNRKTHKAYNRVRDAGVVGAGKIGKCLVEILVGFGMNLLAYDRYQDEEFARRTGLKYVELDELFKRADVISLHAPLIPETHHIINAEAIAKMKPGVMLINTSRGALIDTVALIEALKSGKVGAAGLDVYEEEEEYFFEDLSSQIITDDLLARLMTFNNVLITSHQAFLTHEALDNIADTTFSNIREYQQGKRLGELTNSLLPVEKQ